MRRLTPKGSLSIVAWTLAWVTVSAAPLSAQQILEVVPAEGRAAVSDSNRAILPFVWTIAVDHDRRHLYVEDAVEPGGITVLSLATGELVRTVSIPQGEGPGEMEMIMTFLPLSSGGTLVSSFHKVIALSPAGEPVGSWTTEDMTGRNICQFAGMPLVTTPTGLVRLEPGGRQTPFGGWKPRPVVDRESFEAFHRNVIACDDDNVFLSAVPDSRGVVSLQVLDRRGLVSEMSLPSEFVEEFDWQTYGFRLTFDGRGNLVLVAQDRDLLGSVIDPESGCYAILRHPDPSIHSDFFGIVSDSALYIDRAFEEDTVDGRRRVTLYADARRVVLLPFRRVSGEPCPGMFTSLDNQPRGSAGS